MRLRKNVWTLEPLDASAGAPWDPILEWYARAVAHMQTRPIKSPASWTYQAAIHEYRAGVPPNTEPANTLPSSAERARFWSQCQHQSWFFLPWHRMYLAYFEQIVAAAIAEIGGPADLEWALPYWNYSDPDNPRARSLPPAFYLPRLPDGTPNALRIAQRNAGCNTGQIIASRAAVSLEACLDERHFKAEPTGGNPGFGGPATGFSHGGGNNPVGKVEAVPHGSMHMAVGGFMGRFNTAGLDPLFWLHHANIDRLWQVWQMRAPLLHRNPAEAAWRTAQTFAFNDAAGAVVSHTASEFEQTASSPLPYTYDDLSDPLSEGPVGPVPGPAAAAEEGGRAMGDQRIPEMVGATAAPVTLTGAPTTIRFPVVEATGPSAGGPAAGTAAAGARDAAPEMYVNIEHITGDGQGQSYEVYVNVPPGEDPREHPELFAGLLPMFGLEEATRGDDTHAADGLRYALAIGRIVQRLQAEGRWDPADLQLTFVPDVPLGLEPAAGPAGIAPTTAIRIGRVSLYVS